MYNDPSNSKSWKVLETVSNHLKVLVANSFRNKKKCSLD